MSILSLVDLLPVPVSVTVRESGEMEVVPSSPRHVSRLPLSRGSTAIATGQTQAGSSVLTLALGRTLASNDAGEA